MGCSSCPGKKTKLPIGTRETYFVGEEGFTEVRYIGWQPAYKVYGEKHWYFFDDKHRVKLVDNRDVDLLLNTIEDGVKVFGLEN